MSYFDIDTCPDCSRSLRFIKPSHEAVGKIGSCDYCGGAPTYCLACGTKAIVAVHAEMKCPSCGCDKMGEFTVPTKFS